jgi:hydrogenase expression/formation protein HypE
VEAIFEQIYMACRQIGVSVIGGHSEVTYGLSRALAVGTMIGEITSGHPLLPQHIEPEDVLILAGQVPVEAGAILALELPDRLAQDFSLREIEKLAGALHDPGISVLSAARAAQAGGTVHAMHDPTEGGLYTGVWEMAIASGLRLEVDLSAAPVLPLAGRACRLLGIDPLGAIASGALLIAAPPQAGAGILRQLQAEGIQATSIGRFLPGEAGVVRRTPGADGSQAVPYPQQDELARLFATRA